MKPKLTKIVQYLDDILNFKDKEYTNGEPWHPRMLCSHEDTWEPVKKVKLSNNVQNWGMQRATNVTLSSSWCQQEQGRSGDGDQRWLTWLPSLAHKLIWNREDQSVYGFGGAFSLPWYFILRFVTTIVNEDLGCSPQDGEENVWRIAEVAKLKMQA